jgi:hypothetical protein
VRCGYVGRQAELAAFGIDRLSYRITLELVIRDPQIVPINVVTTTPRIDRRPRVEERVCKTGLGTERCFTVNFGSTTK